MRWVALSLGLWIVIIATSWVYNAIMFYSYEAEVMSIPFVVTHPTQKGSIAEPFSDNKDNDLLPSEFSSD